VLKYIEDKIKMLITMIFTFVINFFLNNLNTFLLNNINHLIFHKLNLLFYFLIIIFNSNFNLVLIKD